MDFTYKVAALDIRGEHNICLPPFVQPQLRWERENEILVKMVADEFLQM